jgi:hypothetical protein
LEKERRLEIQRFIKEGRALAARHAAIPRAAVRDQARALQTIAKKSGFFTVPSFTLDKPVRISARPRKILKMSRIKPFDSFAKIRVDRRQEGQDKLFFIFEWLNRSTNRVAIDAVTFLSASGFLELIVSGGVFLHWGFLTGSAQIALGPLSRSIPHETQNLKGGLMAVNHPVVPGDGLESGASHNAFNLTALHHPVGAFQTVLIEISLTIDSDCGSSFQSKADFESGPLGVSCPLVVVWVHQVPPVITPD